MFVILLIVPVIGRNRSEEELVPLEMWVNGGNESRGCGSVWVEWEVGGD